MDQPIIEEDNPNKHPSPAQPIDEEIPEVKEEQSDAVKIEGEDNPAAQPEMSAEALLGEVLGSLPAAVEEEEKKLIFRERRTRWGERQIKRSKIQEDAVFNPLESLYHGKTLLPITQYGQAELEIKLSLYSDGKRRKSKYSSIYSDGTTRSRRRSTLRC
jgi:hypothetical protein